MKFSNIVLALACVGSANAFVPAASRTNSPIAVFSTTEDATVTEAPVKETAVETMTGVIEKPMDVDMPMQTLDEVMEAESTVVDRIIPGRYNDKENSIAVPFLKRPVLLDGTHAGDYGFDPLGLSEQLDLFAMQEAEIRHGRLAMLAVIGWPMSELIAPSWMLQQNGCAPSVLNGFSPVSFLAVAGIFAALGFFEVKTSLRTTWDTPMGKQHEEDMSLIWKYGVAGDYNFDPLNLYASIGDNANARKGLRDVEIGHGRMAMLGITYFAAWEAITAHPITENSIFFSPNPVLPALVAAYAAFRTLYEVKPSDQYLVRLEKTSEGDAIVERLKMEAGNAAEANKDLAIIAGNLADKSIDLAKDAKKTYDNLGDNYLEFSTRNIKEGK